MTIRILGITHADVDQSGGDGSIATSFATGSDAVYNTTTPHYASVHYRLNIAVDSNYNAYVSMGTGTAGGNDTTVGNCDGVNNKGYIWFHYLNSEGGQAPIWLVATTTQNQMASGWSIQNRGGGFGPNAPMLLSAGNAWWWHGGYDQAFNQDGTNDGTWISMNDYYHDIIPDSQVGMTGGSVGNPRRFYNIYYMLNTNTQGPDALVEQVTAETQDEMIATMKNYGYRFIGELELIPKEGGGYRAYVYCGGGIFYADERKSATTFHTETKTLLDSTSPTDETTLYYHTSLTRGINVYGFPAEIQNLDQIIDQDYYPWAIKKSTGWMSCNRTDAYLKIKDGSDWRDCKNGREPDTVHQLIEGSWEVAPKIGLEA